MNQCPESIIILMAEDDPDDRLLTQQAFKDQRLLNELHIVEDGAELMDYLHQRGKYADPATSPRPGLILLDLNMPKLDGRESLAQIKADPSLRRIPVVILTTSQAEEDVLYYQARVIRRARRRRESLGEVLVRNRGIAQRIRNVVS